MKKMLVVLSGGQDSATCLLWALRETGYQADMVSAISFDYGQRHTVELESAAKICKFLHVPHEVVDVGGLLRSTSPLVDHAKKLEQYSGAGEMDAIIGDRIELTFVPLRNPFFLMVAANYAVAAGCDTLVTGVCEEDNANYPDCTSGFVESISHTINEALGRHRFDYKGPGFQVATPLLYKTKAQTVKMAMEMPLGAEVMAMTHTCYQGEVPPCGRCHACVLRAAGFEEAGVADPLIEVHKPQFQELPADLSPNRPR